jgi:hypothetical protein
MKNTQKICLTVIFILAVTSLANAAVLEVGPPGGSVGTLGDIHVYPFAKIQDAVDYAQPGDTILIHDGIYDEQVVVPKDLTLQGVEGNAIVKPSSAAKLTQVFTGLWYAGGTKNVAGIIVANVAAGTSVTLANLKVDGSSVTTKPTGADYLAGIFYRETGGVIDSVSIVGGGAWSGGDRGYGCYISAGTNTVSVEVKDSTITNFDKNGMEVMGDKLTADIHNNTITGRGPTPVGDEVQNGISVGRDAVGTVNDNTISNLEYGPKTWWAAGIIVYHYVTPTGKSATANGNTITDCQIGIMFKNANASAQDNTVSGGTVGLAGIHAQPNYQGAYTASFVHNTVSGITDYSAIDAETYATLTPGNGATLTITISNNRLTGGYGAADGVYVGGGAGSVTATIDSDNIISGWPEYGINLGDACVAGATITGNTITNNVQEGVHVDAAVDATKVTVNSNKIVNNQTYGVDNLGTGVLNAENNWWGDVTGPYHPLTNIAGLGNEVSDNVDYDPWCTDETCGTTGTNPVRNITKGTTYDTIKAAIADADPDNSIVVSGGIYVETGQLVIDKNLTITGAGAGSTVVKKNENTGDTGSGTNRGWFLVTAGNSLTLSDVTLDGDGRQICFAVLSYGTADVNDCEIKNISWSAESYYGRGVCLYANAGNVVRNCTFSNIRRIGVFAFNSGVSAEIDGITYTGKGVGDFLDYGIELGNGAVAEIKNSTITDCNGVASDGSISAGILVTTYFGAGTSGTITNNVLTKNSYGIAVGYNNDDTSVVVARCNKIAGNIEAGVDNIVNANNVVDATLNWWGSATGPSGAGGGSGDAVSENVDFFPWLQSENCDDYTVVEADYVVDDDWAGLPDWTTVIVNSKEYYIGINAFDTVQEAIDAANDGNSISVGDGNYAPFTVVSKTDLTIMAGSNPVVQGVQSVTTAYGLRDCVVFIKDSTNVVLNQLDIQGIGLGTINPTKNNYGVICENSSGSIISCTVSPNTSGNMSSAAIGIWDGSVLTVKKSLIENFGRIGIFAYNAVTAEVLENEIVGQVYADEGQVNYGIEVEGMTDDPATASNVTIKRNTIYNCDNTFSPEPSWGSSAILINGWLEYGPEADSTVTIVDNDIRDNHNAIYAVKSPSSRATLNNIVGNRVSGVESAPAYDDTTAVFDAEYNWWGKVSGPNDPCGTTETDGTDCYDVSEILNLLPVDGLGNGVSENVIYCAWLIAPANTSTKPCPAGDLDFDCDVDFKDLAILADNWLKGT